MNANERFEIIGDLYYAKTGHLRPGKSSTFEDSMSQENIDRFKDWIKEDAFECALKRIHTLEKYVGRDDANLGDGGREVSYGV